MALPGGVNVRQFRDRSTGAVRLRHEQFARRYQIRRVELQTRILRAKTIAKICLGGYRQDRASAALPGLPFQDIGVSQAR